MAAISGFERSADRVQAWLLPVLTLYLDLAASGDVSSLSGSQDVNGEGLGDSGLSTTLVIPQEDVLALRGSPRPWNGEVSCML